MNHNYSLGYKYASRQPKRALLLVAGIAIAIMLMTAVFITTEVYRSVLIKQATEQYGAWHITYETDSIEAANLIRQHSMVESACLILEHGFYKVNANKKIALITASSQGIELTGMVVSKGRLPENPHEMVIEDWMAGILNIKNYPVSMKMNDVEYTITGTIKSRAEALRRGTSAGLMLYDLNTGLIEKGHRHTLLIRFKPEVDIVEGIKSLESFPGLYADKDFNGKTSPKENHSLLQAEGKRGQDSNYGLMNTIGLIISGIVLLTLVISIYNIVNISVYDRIRQFGLLRAVGLSPPQLFRMVIQETIVLCVFAIPLGILMGIGLSWFFLLKLGFFYASGMSLVIPFGKLSAGIIFSIAAVLISCIIPASRAARISPVGAIRNGSGINIKESKIKAPGLSLFSKVRNSYLFPVILSYRSLWRRKKSFVFTVLTLSFSIFLLIVYSFVAKTDRARIIDRIDVYPADFMIHVNYLDHTKPYAERLDKEVTPPDMDFITSIENIEGVQHVFTPNAWNGDWEDNNSDEDLRPGDFSVDVLLDHQKVAARYKEHYSDYHIQAYNGKFRFASIVIGYGDKELDIMENYLYEGSIDTDLMKNEFVVLIPKYDMEVGTKNIPYTSMKTGDSVDIVLKDKKITAVVGGLFENLPFAPGWIANEGFMIVMHRDKLAEFTGSSKCYSVYIKLDENADRESVRIKLENIAGTMHGYEVSPDLVNNPYEIEMMRLQTQADMAIYGILACIAVISLLTIINIISSNIIVRLKEFGMLRATGMTGTQLGILIICDGLFYGLISWLTGTFAGLAASYAIYKFIQSRYSIIVWITPWPEILIALAVCTIGSIISTSLPLSKIRNMSVVENINNVE